MMKRLYLPIEQLSAWAKLNGVMFHGCEAKRITADGIACGSGLFATAAHEEHEILVSVPQEIVLTPDRVEQHAKLDKHLREVLAACGEFGRSARIASLIFLLMQVTHADPDIAKEGIGVTTLFTDYLKFIPQDFSLPTFYSEQELDLMSGTSLEDAVTQKLRSLGREFDMLRTSTNSIRWCSKHWWNEETGRLTIDDWKQVDAMFRSRCFDVRSTKHAMMPCVDMSNHASGDATKAFYATDDDGNATLQLFPGKGLRPGEEVTITYGDEKGASEMIFSYGFIESGMQSAQQLFLDLDIPSDDPLRIAKKRVCDEAPGVRIYQGADGTYGWESNFVWWACVNEEDGLKFRMLQSNNGDEELVVTWKDQDLSPSNLEETLRKELNWDVFQLRVVVLLQERVGKQGVQMQASEGFFAQHRHSSGVREEVWSNIKQLRELEMQLLTEAYRHLDAEKTSLLKSQIVQEFLRAAAPGQVEDVVEDDFS